MPRWLRRFLSGRSLKSHLLISLAFGGLLRLLSAFFVYGPQALDDYKHGVWPAYQFFAGLPLDLPDYRSHLLIWMLSGFLQIGKLFAIESALGQVRVMYMGLALISLLGIYGTYIFVRGLRSHRIFAPLALYMVAVFPLMPFVSTRAFGEAVALSFVVLAFGILEEARRNRSPLISQWIAGFAFLGLATLFRYHVGLLYLAYAAVLLGLRLWRAMIGVAIAGGLTLAGELTIDWLSGKAPLGTLLAYLNENQGGAVAYGVSPWYNTWLLVLAISLAPFSLVFARQVPALWRRNWPWLVPFLFFVTVHSFVPHKEERFLYPIVGLELWALAWLWSSAAWTVSARRIFTPAFFGLGIPLLFVFCLVNTQEGEIEPPAFTQSRYPAAIYLDNESLFGLSRFQFYFLRRPAVLQAVEREELSAHRIDEALQAYPTLSAVVLLTSVPESRDRLYALERIKTMAGECQQMRTAGSLIDRLLFAMNPKHNQRRRPTWYLICERV